MGHLKRSKRGRSGTFQTVQNKSLESPFGPHLGRIQTGAYLLIQYLLLPTFGDLDCIIVHNYLPMMHSIFMWRKAGSVFLFLLILLPYSIADDFSTSLPIESISDDQGGDPELFNHGFGLLSAGTENSGAGVDNCGDHSSVPADAHINNFSRKKRSALRFRQKKREETGAGKSRVCNWQEKKGNTTPGTQVPSPGGTAQHNRPESPAIPPEPKGIDFGTDQESWPPTIDLIDLISPPDRIVGTANEQVCPGQDNVPVCYYPFPSSARFPFLVGSRSARRFVGLTPCRACKDPSCCF